MCVIKKADGLYHRYLTSKINYLRDEKSMEGYLEGLNKEQLNRIREHAVKYSKPDLVSKIDLLLGVEINQL